MRSRSEVARLTNLHEAEKLRLVLEASEASAADVDQLEFLEVFVPRVRAWRDAAAVAADPRRAAGPGVVRSWLRRWSSAINARSAAT